MTTCLRTGLPALVLACSALWGPAHAADEKLLAAARAAQPAVVEALREMVAIESGTMDAAGLAKMADDVERRLKALGASVDRQKVSPGHSEVLKATFKGTGRRKLMLIGHMDTVYWPGTIQSQPWKQVGNRLYGPGIADDKGGLAVMMQAVALLHASGWRDYAQLTLLVNGDEESGSNGSGPTIAAQAAEHDTVLSFEPTSATDTPQGEGVLLNAAGATSLTMHVKGRSSHAGAAPQLGRNALIEAAYQMLQTQDVAKGVSGAQLNWTTFETGKTRNQIPETATANADVGLTEGDAGERLLAAMRAKVAEGRRVPDTTVTLELAKGRPPFVGDARTMALAKRAQAIYAELDGRKLALHPITGGGTDAGFASQSGKAAVLESMGLPGAGYHARDEYIEIDTIVPRLYLTSRMLVELGRE
jgi:glutamate carboxypeptidase